MAFETKFLKHDKVMKSLNIFVITLVLTSPNEASESSCDSLMKYNEKISTFQSPNYPSSIGNGSLMCNLRIQHAPSIEDVQMQVQQECQGGGGGGGNSGGNGGGDENGQNDGSGGHEAICQVSFGRDFCGNFRKVPQGSSRFCKVM